MQCIGKRNTIELLFQRCNRLPSSKQLSNKREDYLQNCSVLHCESKKGATLSMAITLSILDRFANFFQCCKEHEIYSKTHIRLPTTP